MSFTQLLDFLSQCGRFAFPKKEKTMRNRRKLTSRVEFDLSHFTYIEVYCELQKLKEKEELTLIEQSYLAALETRFIDDMEKERSA